MSTSGPEDCPVCLTPLADKRYLGCQHAFCLPCLRLLQQRSYVRCPVCRLYTALGDGSVTVLPATVHDSDPGKSTARVRKKITVNGFATSAFIDQRRRRILVASNHASVPIQIFDYAGNRTGGVDFANLRGLGFSLTMDTKRDRIVAITNMSVHVLDAAGQWIWSVTFLDAKYNDLCYDEVNDRYVLVDREKRRLAQVHPDTRELAECGEEELDCPWAIGARTFPPDAAAADDTGSGRRSGAIAVNDFGTRSLKLLNADQELSLVASVDIGQSVFGHLSHVCGVAMGRTADEVILCDSGHRRIVSVTTDGTWACMVNAEEFGYEIPHDVHISEDGLMVVTSFIDRGSDRASRDSTVYIIDCIDH